MNTLSEDDPGGPAPDRRAEAVFYLAAIAVGAIAGTIGTILNLGTARVLTWPDRVVAHFGSASPAALLTTGAFGAAMVVASLWLVRTFAPEAGGSGVQETEGAMVGLRRVRWLRVLLVKFFGAILSLGSGLVVGREGPSIHIGACIAQAFNVWLRLPVRDAHGMLAAGGAAGLAAAFSAPLASIIFVIEETRREFPYSLKTYTGVMLASVASGIVTLAIAGRRPFMAMTVPEVPLVWLPAFVVLGILLGGLGVVFNRTLIWALDTTRAIGLRWSFYIGPAFIGFVIGILLLVLPEATKGGENLAVRLAEANLPLTIIAFIIVVRFAMSMASYATGVPGGIFAPILSLATAVGLFFGLCLGEILPLPEGGAAAFAVAAMGGLFTSTVRSPLVGIVLIAELTGAYTVLVPAIVTCTFANFIADWLGGRPIYTVLLERTLKLSPANDILPPNADQKSAADRQE